MNLPKPQKFSARLTSVEKVSAKVYLERYQLVEPPEMTFLAGQTVMLYVAPGINRSMSIASVPDEKNSILLAHDVGPMGPYSQWTLSAKPGDAMSFMGPLGIFVVDKESTRKKVFVSTGSGIAPFYPMAKDYLVHGGTSEIILYWGLRHEEDIFWQEELDGLAGQFTNFRYIITLSQGSEGWAGKRGHVQDQLFTGGQNFPGSDFYLCGNKTMTNDMRDRLKTAGVPDTQVKFELFY